MFILDCCEVKNIAVFTTKNLFEGAVSAHPPFQKLQPMDTNDTKSDEKIIKFFKNCLNVPNEIKENVDFIFLFSNGSTNCDQCVMMHVSSPIDEDKMKKLKKNKRFIKKNINEKIVKRFSNMPVFRKGVFKGSFIAFKYPLIERIDFDKIQTTLESRYGLKHETFVKIAGDIADKMFFNWYCRLYSANTKILNKLANF